SHQEQEKKFKEWSQSEYVKVAKYCNTKGYQIKKIDQKKCQTLPPLLSIWFVKTTDKNLDLWVISGDFPTDLTNAGVAKNARQSLRHFSMSWHMQAAKLEEGVATGRIELQDRETQSKFATDLTRRAENLYQIFNDDNLWKATGLSKD
ncbi:MAG: DUF4826 family protein, partial [Kangiellaceae bacterium]|nr:DUF4826 family protein [Kangiellaceae bacterium]